MFKAHSSWHLAQLAETEAVKIFKISNHILTEKAEKELQAIINRQIGMDTLLLVSSISIVLASVTFLEQESLLDVSPLPLPPPSCEPLFGMKYNRKALSIRHTAPTSSTTKVQRYYNFS